MFLILNNELTFNKQIMTVNPPPCPEKTTYFNDINATGYTTGQIYIQKDIILVINGNIKNLKKIAQKMGSKTQSMEILIELYKKYDFEYMLQLLHGEFSIILLDRDINKSDSKLFIAQDRLGLSPLYILTEDTTTDRKIIAFSNTVKQLHMDSMLYETKYNIQSFIPGTYTKYHYPFKVLSYWKPCIQNMRYVNSFTKNIITFDSKTERNKEFLKSIEYIRDALKESIKSDINNIVENTYSEEYPDINDSIPFLDPPSHPLPNISKFNTCSKNVYTVFIPKNNGFIGKGPIACLLSGGINSSLITALIKDYIVSRDYDQTQLYTFTMGLSDSNDLIYGKEVAEYLGIINQYTGMIIDENEYIKTIPIVIDILETVDVAIIRYGTALYLLLKHIHDTTNIRDIFTGDGANEIMGGYLNFYYMNNLIEHDFECNRLLNEYYTKGALYYKLFNYFGMRWYRPFLNISFLEKYMSIPIEFKYSDFTLDNKTDSNNMSKQDISYNIFMFDKNLLRIAFSNEYYMNCCNNPLLSKKILCRTVEPGYDSISSYYRPLCKIISEKLDDIKLSIDDTDESIKSNSSNNYIGEPIKEIEYYKDIYINKYPYMKPIVNDLPYKYSMNKYEPSMRNLDIYLDFHMEYQDRSL